MEVSRTHGGIWSFIAQPTFLSRHIALAVQARSWVAGPGAAGWPEQTLGCLRRWWRAPGCSTRLLRTHACTLALPLPPAPASSPQVFLFFQFLPVVVLLPSVAFAYDAYRAEEQAFK